MIVTIKSKDGYKVDVTRIYLKALQKKSALLIVLSKNKTDS